MQFAGIKLTTFYLVRHAHARWSQDENRPLSAMGIKDAVHVGNKLCKHPITLIYSSPAKRARQTISPLAELLGIPIQIEPDLQERKLGSGVFDDFFKAVEVTWQDPSFAHLGGESSVNAQKRGIAMVQQLLERHPTEHIVLSTHGNLMALILQAFDPSVDFMFWKSLSMPDIFQLTTNQTGHGFTRRLWQGAAK